MSAYVLLVFPSAGCAVKVEFGRGQKVLDYLKLAKVYNGKNRCELNGVPTRHSAPVASGDVLVIHKANPRGFP